MIHGGTAFNVIPDSATIAGTFRAFSKKSFYALRERIEEVTRLSRYIKLQKAIPSLSSEYPFLQINQVYLRNFRNSYYVSLHMAGYKSASGCTPVLS